MFKTLSRLDYRIFDFFHSFGNVTALDWLFVAIASYLAYLMVVIVAAAWFVSKDRFETRKAVILAAISGLIAREVVANIIRALWHRDRPYIKYQLHDLINKTDTQGSFPSGHAIAMFAVASAIYYYNRRVGIVLYIMAVLTAFGRVIVGVHYPSDVVAGAFLGMATTYVVIKLLDKRIEPLTQTLSNFSDKVLSFTKSKDSGNIT